MPRTIRIAVVCALSAMLLGAAALPAQAARPPKQFFGLQPINRISDQGFQKLGQGKIGTYRVGFFWSEIEPAPGLFNWVDPDENVRRGAQSGVEILPVLFGTPGWADRETHDRPPRTAAGKRAYVEFVKQAVRRYGPKGPGGKGAFWTENPSVKYKPIRSWQIWNEPNLAQFWPCKKRGNTCRPVAKEYANFAAPASKVVKSLDRRAKVVLAGLPETKSASPLLPYLTALYKAKVGGKSFKNFFDAVALHPYARDQNGVKAAVIAIRKVMSKGGDGKTPLWLTEIGWASGGSNRNFAVGSKRQASLLTATYKFLIGNRQKYRIGMAVWFTMQDRPPDSTYAPDAWQRQAGLFTVAGKPKPAWKAMLKFTGAGKAAANGSIGQGTVGRAPAPGPGGPSGDGGSGANPDGDPASGGGGAPAGSGSGGSTPPPCMLPGGLPCP